MSGAGVGMRPDGVRRRAARPGPKDRARRGAPSRPPKTRGIVGPSLAGMLDALNGDDVPADERPAIPFEELDRLRFWQARRRAQEALLLLGANAERPAVISGSAEEG